MMWQQNSYRIFLIIIIMSSEENMFFNEFDDIKHI